MSTTSPLVHVFGIVGLVAGAWTLSVAEEPPAEVTPPSARAEFVNGKGEKVGTATLTEDEMGVHIKVELAGLPPGKHAFHIHASASCEGPDFTSAGGHFNPKGKKHGLKNPEGPHAGDLPNLEVGADGACSTEVIADRVTLGAGKRSLLEGAGTSLVIHEKEDDDKTDPAGNAGARIACGPIRKLEPEKK